jgi:arylsulfatase A-like enzyme
MRVPFIAAWAASNSANVHQQKLPIPSGAIQPQIASVCDLFPTILNLIGANTPAGHTVDGHGLNSLLSGKPDPKRPTTFLMHYPHAPHRSDYWTSYRDGRWKVIYHYFPSAVSENSHYQLFDLDRDPFEQQNLAASHPEELKRMMERLINSLESHHAAYPIHENSKEPNKPKLPS